MSSTTVFTKSLSIFKSLSIALSSLSLLVLTGCPGTKIELGDDDPSSENVYAHNSFVWLLDKNGKIVKSNLNLKAGEKFGVKVFLANESGNPIPEYRGEHEIEVISETGSSEATWDGKVQNLGEGFYKAELVATKAGKMTAIKVMVDDINPAESSLTKIMQRIGFSDAGSRSEPFRASSEFA